MLFDGLDPKIVARVHNRIEEIKKLYDISEAEGQLLIHLSLTVSMLCGDWSPTLRIKILRAYTAISEAILEEVGDERVGR